MRKTLAIYLALLLLSLPAGAQPDTLWTSIIGDSLHQQGYSVQQTLDGGFIVVGYTEIHNSPFNHDDVFMIKTHANGDTIWTRTFGGRFDDVGRSVQQTSDEGYIITGKTLSFGIGHDAVYLIKTDALGDTIWTRIYEGHGENFGYSVQQTQEGGYIIAGDIYCDSANGCDVYLIKTDENGDTLWTRTFGGEGYDCGRSVQQTLDGGYIITGNTGPYSSTDVWLIKTDGNGDTTWTRTYGENYKDAGSCVQQTTDGGYIIVGYRGEEMFENDVYLIKTNAGGDTTWSRTFGGDYQDEGYSVQQTSDGGYIVAGSTVLLGQCINDVLLIKTDALGGTEWMQTFGGPNIDFGMSAQQTMNEGYIVAGTYGSAMGDVYLIRLDSGGAWVEDFSLSRPLEYGLYPVYPNPFNSQTRLTFTIPQSGEISLIVYDIGGREVARLYDGWYPTGQHEAIFNASGLSSGIYFVRLQAKSITRTQKILLIK